MVEARNPFKPSFGTSPPVLAGRNDILERFTEALEEGRDGSKGNPDQVVR